MKDIKKSENNLISGALSLTLSVIIVKIIGFIYKLPLSYVLGDEGMGYFNSAYTVFSFFYLLSSSGIPRAISILVTEKTVNNDACGREKILNTAVKIFTVTGVILFAVMLIFSMPISKLIGNRNSYFSLLLISPSLLIVSLSGVFRGYLNGVSDILPISVSQVVEVGVKFISGLVLALVGVKMNLDLSCVSAMTVMGVSLGSFLSTIYLYTCIKKREKIFNIRQKNKCEGFDKEVLKRILVISFPIVLSSAIIGISNIIDLGIIMRRLSTIGYTEVEANALYGNYTTLVMPMLNFITALVSPISVAALPMISGAFYLKQRDLLVKNSKFLIGVTSFICIPISFIFLMFSEEILTLLFNDNSALIASPLLKLLTPSMIFLPLLTLINTILEATENAKLPIISMSIAAVFKFLVSYFMIGNEKIGILGAPIGTSVSYGTALIVSVVLLFAKTKIDISFLSGVFKPLLTSFISVFTARCLYISIPEKEKNIAFLFVSIAVGMLFYILLSFLFGIFSEKSIKELSKLPKKS